ncbi:ABC transporter ATP-binding protein [Limibaculum sp. FT325]|uniref:ABC transporter ATP-binding protein n=1 Tax=Thermohalobaculum sediminis TaxID=2939436 RepID=UPI0020BE4CCC|nr:ABC transporter ATP-binding protein [Limibaculum sediminis]MCL5777961.1 ABC transporter ATP-binding protein [Limibaculum sediminis]
MAVAEKRDTPLKPWRDPSAVPHLKIVDLVKRFGETVAVDHVSLDIYRGEFFALLGPSGCGKTTLLRMLAGFETPDSGQILLGGEDLSRIPPYERPVNMMFQSYALFPHMTVEQNIAFGLQMERMPRPQIRERVAEMLALTRLEKFARRRPDQLSGGQRQRVALARALAKKPKLLLLDEPLGALDRKLREATQFELVNIQETLGLTFVIVTHDQEEAMTVSTRLAVMRDGKVAQVGEPQEVYEAPASRYVADFIGDVNVLTGGVRGDGTIDLAAGGTAQCPAAASRSEGTAVELALRPEKISLSRAGEGEAAGVNEMVGHVEDIAYLGDMSIYHVRVTPDLRVKVARTNRLRAAEREITWGDPVRLAWDASALVLLQE